MTRLTLKATVLVAMTAMATPAMAGETISSAGVGKGTNQTSIEVISEGHMLMHTVSTYESFESSVANNPYGGTTGKCWGAVEIRVPNASGGGNCLFVNAAGDKNFNAWTVTGLGKDGALQGRWTAIGGTGKYKNITGGGTFNSLADRKTGTFVNTV
ncbi:MAG: hypothetical protein ABJ358_19465, partial [Rhizobiaceae bacterium]